MRSGKLEHRLFLFALLAAGLSGLVTIISAQTNMSGIVKYFLDPNPEEFGSTMYNWEVVLNALDSRNGPYAIVRIDKLLRGKPKALETAPERIIDSDMIAQGNDGIIAFKLGIGMKESKNIPDGSGNAAQPIVFSGKGSGKGESSWINFPGSNVKQVVPSDAGTVLSGGRLLLMRFIVSDNDGAEIESDVVLCTLASIGQKNIEHKLPPALFSGGVQPFDQTPNGLELLWSELTMGKQSPDFQNLIVAIAVRNISDSEITLLTENLQDDLVNYKDRPEKPLEIHIDFNAFIMENGKDIIPPLSAFSPLTLKPDGTTIIRHICKVHRIVKEAIVVFDMFSPVSDRYHTWKGRLRSGLVSVKYTKE
jgi:hypothetical protein